MVIHKTKVLKNQFTVSVLCQDLPLPVNLNLIHVVPTTFSVHISPLEPVHDANNVQVYV